MVNDLLAAEKHLCKNDPTLDRIICEIGSCAIKIRDNYLESIVGSIISQQLSNFAASAIIKRLHTFSSNGITVTSLEKLSVEDLRSIGVSYQKANFIKNIAEIFDTKPQFFDNLKNLNNEQVIKELTSIKGIGVWTAQMFLIFSLGRLDILPTADVGFKRSIQHYYNLHEKPTDQHIINISKNWGDYPSVAAWYLWQAIDNRLFIE